MEMDNISLCMRRIELHKFDEILQKEDWSPLGGGESPVLYPKLGLQYIKTKPELALAEHPSRAELFFNTHARLLGGNTRKYPE